MNNNITYSIVVPVYNSENSLSELCKGIINTLSQFSFEIIFVDDGSTDKSWQVITELKNEYPSIVNSIQLQKNYGQHAALSCAFSFCKGDFTITIDDDLQYNPKDILLLIQEQKKINADVVYGIINNKQDSLIRNFGHNNVQFISRILEGNKNKGSSFRLLNKKIVQAIVKNHNNSFMFLDIILRWYTSSFAFVEVSHSPRSSGKSGYTTLKLLNLTLTCIKNYSILPFKAITYLGFFFSIIFFIFSIYLTYIKLINNAHIGYISIIVAVFFSTSIIIFCLGIIAQLIHNTYISHQNKPLYSIKQILL